MTANLYSVRLYYARARGLVNYDSFCCDFHDGRWLGRAAEGQHGSDAEGYGGPGALYRQGRRHLALQVQSHGTVLSSIGKQLENVKEQIHKRHVHDSKHVYAPLQNIVKQESGRARQNS